VAVVKWLKMKNKLEELNSKLEELIKSKYEIQKQIAKIKSEIGKEKISNIKAIVGKKYKYENRQSISINIVYGEVLKLRETPVDPYIIVKEFMIDEYGYTVFCTTAKNGFTLMETAKIISDEEYDIAWKEFGEEIKTNTKAMKAV
jgi:hypothetical protein